MPVWRGSALFSLDKTEHFISTSVITAVALDEGLKLLALRLAPARILINHGVAFGLGNSIWLGIGAVIVVIIGATNRFKSLGWRLLVGTVLTTNLLDRAWTGGVIDYLNLGPLHFNLSDLTILGLVIWQLRALA